MKSRYFNCYKSSHKDNPILLSFDIDQLADTIVAENYGCHRMVCALADAERRKFPDSELAEALENVASQFTI